MSVPFDLNITLTPGALDALRRWPTLAPLAMQKMAKALDLENQLTIAHAQKDKLSGPRPQFLGVVTNRLRGSINAPPSTVSSETINSAIGSNAAYAGAHEYGFDGPVQVRAFVRRTRSRDIAKDSFVKKTVNMGGFTFEGKVRRHKVLAQGISYVKAFTRHMRMPERSFIRSSISDRIENYGASLSQAVVNVMGGSQ